jgi:hypothetical protein
MKDEQSLVNKDGRNIGMPLRSRGLQCRIHMVVVALFG